MPMNSPLCTVKFISLNTSFPERSTVKFSTFKIGSSQQISSISDTPIFTPTQMALLMGIKLHC